MRKEQGKEGTFI